MAERIAVVSDVHGNVTAFEAVETDLRAVAPDVVFHGGDLANGPRGAEIVDRIRSLGWRGVLGNTDQALFRPESLTEFARQAGSQFAASFEAIEEMAAWERERLGSERLGWLRELPMVLYHKEVALVHAKPKSTWRAPQPEASESEFVEAYAGLRARYIVYGHIHRAFVRRVEALTIVNAGSVSLPHDSDPRAAYAVLDGDAIEIRRVSYDVDQEVQATISSGMPHAEWLARSLRAARPQAL